MNDKQKLQFKLPPTKNRIKTISKQKEISKQYSLRPPNSERNMGDFNDVYERIEMSIQDQNARIQGIQNKYNQAVLSKFDKLININYKIGKNLEKLVQRFEAKEKSERLQKSERREKEKGEYKEQTDEKQQRKWSFQKGKKLEIEKKEQQQNEQTQEKKEVKMNQIILQSLSLPPKPKKKHPNLSIITPKIFEYQQSQVKQNKNFHFDVQQKQKIEQDLGDDGWDRNTVANGQLNKSMNYVQPIVNALFQNYNLQSPRHLKTVSPGQQSTLFTNIFRTMVEFQFTDEAISESMNKLLGSFYHKTAEFYYQQYSSGRIKFEDMKIKFSSDILNHAIEMCEKWIEYAFAEGYDQIKACKFRKQNFFKIFDRAAVNTLQYLIHKYPPTRTKLIDTQLSERIKEIKSFSVIKYDLLRNANMEFGMEPGQKDFTKDIKKWLNSLIKESKSQFPLFKQTMKRIFTNNQGSIDGSKLEPDAQYIICTKISQHTQLYTDDEIRAPGLQIRNPQILRILIKWFQELLSYFINTEEKIMNNKYGFKSTKHKSIPVKIPYSRSKKLISKLTKIYQQDVKPFIKEQETNIGSIMQGLIGISIGGIEGYQFLNQRQATITKLSQNFYQTFKSYMVIFINGVIQNLAKIKQKYNSDEVQSTINLISFTVSDLLRCSCTGTKPQIYRIYNQILNNKDYFEVIRVKNKLNQPTRNILINLKLKQSFLICQVQLSLGSIQEEVNDHFCHYLYQLQRSKLGVLFECASQIANLDPRISYVKKHKNLKFKQNNIVKQKFKGKMRVGQEGIYCSSVHDDKLMNLITSISPYCCFKCNSYIEGYRVRLPYVQCELCRITICTQCIGEYTKENKSIMKRVLDHPTFGNKIIPPHFFSTDQFLFVGQYSQAETRRQILESLESHEYVVLFAAGNTQIYTLVYKKYKLTIVETFSTLLEIPESCINNIDCNNNKSCDSRILCCMVPLLKTQKKKLSELQNLMKYHVFLEWYQLEDILIKNNIEEVICVVSEETKSVLIVDIVETEQAISQSRVQKGMDRRIREINKFNEKYIQITSYNVRNIDFLAKIQNKSNIISMNLWQNKLTDIKLLSEFVNLEELYLQDNLIETLDPILSLNKLILLGIGDNKIAGSFPALNMPNLQFAIFSNNKIDNIDKLKQSNIPNITLLKLAHNPFTSLPELNFYKLEAIALNNCRINDISRFAESNLPSLLYLILQQNQISGGLVKFKFPNLTYLNFSKNKISSYIHFVKSELPKLNKLDLHQNSISQSLHQLNFPRLKQLNLQYNHIRYISQQLLQCKILSEITIVNLNHNKLKGRLPVFKLLSLKILHLSYNEIMDISSLQYSLFQSLEEIRLDHNRIQSKLPRINFKKLKLIDLSFNNIQDIGALKGWKGPNLEVIKLNNNRIKTEIPVIQLYDLKEIDLSQNCIRQESYIDSIHLTPAIERVVLRENTDELKEKIMKKWIGDERIMQILQF